MKTICLHCGNPERVVCRPRGLCYPCYYTPGVRDNYGTSKHRAVRRGSGLDTNGGYNLPPTPTDAPVGSEGKIRVLTERAAMGCGLWHPNDNPETGELCEHSSTRPARLTVKRRSRRPSLSDPIRTG